MTELPSKDPRDSRKVNFGRRTLYKERLGIRDQDFEQPRRLFEVQDVLPKVIKKMGLQQVAAREAFEKIWPEVVGSLLAEHSRPGPLERNTLTIYVDHSTWLAEMKRYGEKKILAKLKDLAPDKPLRRVRLQLDPEG